jgi:hypothetical protein
MGKKITVDKNEAARSSDELESADELESSGGVAVAEATEETEADGTVGGIDIAKIIKSAGTQSAVKGAAPMIDQIASLAKSEAQKASALAMREYRRRLQRIMISMQGTIREEGVRIADEICARVTTQIRHAVLLDTEKKALNLVDEFILGWQIEAESMSQELLTSEPEPEVEMIPEVQIAAPAAVVPALTPESENNTKPVEAAKKEQLAPAAEMPAPSKRQSEPVASDRPLSDTEKKVVFDFATFIAQSKSPVKS